MTEEEKKERLSLEEGFARLNEIVASMESEGLTLEESFARYEEGVRLVKECNAQLDTVEKKVMKLREDGKLDEFEV